jgi:hypothetical protein
MTAYGHIAGREAEEDAEDEARAGTVPVPVLELV